MTEITAEQAEKLVKLMNAPALTVSGLIAELEKIERDGGGNLPVRMHDDANVREACAYDAEGNCRGPLVEVVLHGMR